LRIKVAAVTIEPRQQLKEPVVTIGDKIRKLRQQKGWTQKDLGTRAGIEGKNVSSYETGHLKPSARTIQRFAEALGVSAEDLLSDSSNEPALAVEDPDLLQLFREVSQLPEAERMNAKWFLSVIVKQHRLQQMIAS